MAKRFIETTIWTQNQWFRKLPLKSKLFWFYILSTCDNVGVWEEDFDLASFIIGEKIIKEEAYIELNGKIKSLSDKKIWIVDFCKFQYGELKEEKLDNKPHQSYIKLLKKHSLWQDYLYSIHRVKEKDKEKEKDKDRDKEKDKDRETYQEENYKNEKDLLENVKYKDLLQASTTARETGKQSGELWEKRVKGRI